MRGNTWKVAAKLAIPVQLLASVGIIWILVVYAREYKTAAGLAITPFQLGTVALCFLVPAFLLTYLQMTARGRKRRS